MCAYLQTQCAAVTSHRLLIIVAPQKCPPLLVKLTINGNEPRSASMPPTIRPCRSPNNDWIDGVSSQVEDDTDDQMQIVELEIKKYGF